MTAPAAGFEDLRPAPLADLTGRVDPVSGPAGGRLSFFCNSAASCACFLSANVSAYYRGERSVLSKLTFLR